jgi:hypothetical protein
MNILLAGKKWAASCAPNSLVPVVAADGDGFGGAGRDGKQAMDEHNPGATVRGCRGKTVPSTPHHACPPPPG